MSSVSLWSTHPARGATRTKTGGTWQESRDRCAEDGARLAIVDNTAEDEWVDDLAEWYGDHVWIGLSDLDTEGRWLTVEGTAAPFYDWVPGQPNGTADTDQDCAAVQRDEDAWFDTYCDNTYAYLCEL